MSIELGNSKHVGWYLLSPAKKAVPHNSAEDILEGDGAKVHTDFTSTFQQLILDNLKSKSGGNSAFSPAGKLTFGSTIYYFDHKKYTPDGTATDSADTENHGSGWSPSENFMQNNWSVKVISGKDWGTTTTINETNDPVEISQNNNSTYTHIALDMRFGYWVYIVKNSA